MPLKSCLTRDLWSCCRWCSARISLSTSQMFIAGGVHIADGDVDRPGKNADCVFSLLRISLDFSANRDVVELVSAADDCKVNVRILGAASIDVLVAPG